MFSNGFSQFLSSLKGHLNAESSQKSPAYTYSSSFIIIIIIIIYFAFIEAVFVILKQSSVTVLQKPNIIPVSTTEDFLSSLPSAWFCGLV